MTEIFGVHRPLGLQRLFSIGMAQSRILSQDVFLDIL